MMKRAKTCLCDLLDRRPFLCQGDSLNREGLLQGDTHDGMSSLFDLHEYERLVALAVVFAEVSLALVLSLLYLAGGSRSTPPLQTLLGLLTPLFRPPLRSLVLLSVLGGGVGSGVFFIALAVFSEWVSSKGSHRVLTDRAWSQHSPLHSLPSLLPGRSTAKNAVGTELKGCQPLLLDVEASLISIVAHLLHRPGEQVKRNSDFFQLGGDADTLDELLWAIEQFCQVCLAPGDVFDHPVLSRLAARIATQCPHALVDVAVHT